jgi:hypothetical protein
MKTPGTVGRTPAKSCFPTGGRQAMTIRVDEVEQTRRSAVDNVELALFEIKNRSPNRGALV